MEIDHWKDHQGHNALVLPESREYMRQKVAMVGPFEDFPDLFSKTRDV